MTQEPGAVGRERQAGPEANSPAAQGAQDSPVSDLVSVIIPTYNSAAHIRQTVDAVLAQTHPQVELIVVDDGSTDDTLALLAGYGDRLRVVVQANQGVCKARNVGLAHARGAFICFLDHDDVWYPEMLALQLQAFGGDAGIGCVYAGYFHWYADARGRHADPGELRARFAMDAELDASMSGWIYHLLLIDCHVQTSAAMLRRAVLHECGGYDESLPFSEDWDLWLRVSRRFQFRKLKNVAVLYRQLPGQGSRKMREVDYRTRLLEKAVRTWGLSSPDGTRLPRRQFARQLAQYHADYGMGWVQAGQPGRAVRPLLRALVVNPAQPRPLAYLLLSLFGWRPKWG